MRFDMAAISDLQLDVLADGLQAFLPTAPGVYGALREAVIVEMVRRRHDVEAPADVRINLAAADAGELVRALRALGANRVACLVLGAEVPARFFASAANDLLDQLELAAAPASGSVN